jgi:hypothetical protein
MNDAFKADLAEGTPTNSAGGRENASYPHAKRTGRDPGRSCNPRSDGMKRAHVLFRDKFAHADYQKGMSLAEVGRRYGRHGKSIFDLLLKRGYVLRPSRNHNTHRRNGQFEAYKPHTKDQISEMIAASTKIAVPVELKLEWRYWTLPKRAEFIKRLRSRFPSDQDQPVGPFSRGLEPFDYGSPRAQAIVGEMNAGTDSRTSMIKLNICSQGVIWRGGLWFWSAKVGYQRMGPWTREHGRPSLHHTIWQETHGRKVPSGHVLIFADGNRNNHHPANLQLRTRNDLARQNQAKGLTRKSRAMTALLLKRTQEKGKNHASREIVTAIQQAKDTPR